MLELLHDPPRSTSYEELRRVLQDAQPVLRQNLGSTRFRCESSTNTTNMYRYKTGHSVRCIKDAPELANQSVCKPLEEDKKSSLRKGAGRMGHAKRPQACSEKQNRPRTCRHHWRTRHLQAKTRRNLQGSNLLIEPP